MTLDMNNSFRSQPESSEYELSQSHHTIIVISDASQQFGRDKKNNNDNLDFLPFNLDVASAPVNGDCILFIFSADEIMWINGELRQK